MGARRPAARRRGQSLSARALCRLDELVDGEARGFGPFEGEGAKLIVVRRGGRIAAYWDACPHYGGTPMAWRANKYLNAAGDRIVCASHGAEFEIENGRCMLGAAFGLSLKRAPVEVVAGSVVYAP
jgi:nitrite reductase/ring-hydroxylating ferredoxin subunit